MDVKKVIGENIRRLRKENKMTQEELAAKLGITRQQLHRIETGEQGTPVDRLDVLGSIFGVPRSYFLEEHVDIEKEPDVAHMVDPLLKEAMKEIPRMTPAMRRNLEALFALWRELDKPDEPEGEGDIDKDK